MANVNQALDNLLTNYLTLNASEISQGSKSHNYIRELLFNKNAKDGSFPCFIDGDFLSGSYKRGTKIHPLDDIDVLMIIDGSGLVVVEKGLVIDAEVRGNKLEHNPVINYLGENGLLGSKTIINLVHKALKQSHSESKIYKDNQAVNVWLESYNFGVDVVPCFHILPKNGSKEYYYIPRGGESDDWMSTNPKIDEDISDYVNKKHNEKFKGVVRLLKHWNKNYNNSRIRSYHLETIAWRIFHEHQSSISDYEDGLLYFFNNCRNYFVEQCPDATGLGDNIDKYLSDSDRKLTLEAIDDSIFVLKIGYASTLGVQEESKKLSAWKTIMGDKFNY